MNLPTGKIRGKYIVDERTEQQIKGLQLTNT